MKLNFVTVPDFAAQVRAEQKPSFYAALPEMDKVEYENNLVQQRQLAWACQTSAAACNWLIILSALLILIDGIRIAAVLKAWLMRAAL